MKFISRTLTSLALATGLVLAGSAQAAEKVNIGIVTAPNFVHTIAALKFKEELDKALPGKYDVIIHHSAALGSETQVLQQLQLGTVQMSVCTTGPVEAFVPEVKALEMPFLFSSYEATDKVLDGPIGQDLLKRFEKVGLVGLLCRKTDALEVMAQQSTQLVFRRDDGDLHARIGGTGQNGGRAQVPGIVHQHLGPLLRVEKEVAADAVHAGWHTGHDGQVVRVGERRHHTVG